jgi:hypothetical protein
MHRYAESELFPLIDRVVVKRRGFTIAVMQSGAKFRKLDISLADINESGIKLSTDVLELKTGFADPQTGTVRA